MFLAACFGFLTLFLSRNCRAIWERPGASASGTVSGSAMSATESPVGASEEEFTPTRHRVSSLSAESRVDDVEAAGYRVDDSGTYKRGASNAPPKQIKGKMEKDGYHVTLKSRKKTNKKNNCL